MQTIIAQFDNITAAQEAIRALLERNYDRADIGFLANDVKSDSATGEQSAPAAAGQASLGLLLGLGSFMIPGVGPLLAAGPLAVGLAGAAAGVAQKDAHWLGGVLGPQGVPATATGPYGGLLQRGGALIVMGAREETSDNIIAVLQTSGAVAIDTYARDPKLSGA